ncbi:hypothetical protein COV13_01370 [Candidatus Woesearchaeota archaeon CG10_big_fil_rev_8_21_14_0_10_32_9]|nr:MAG: hypothetical protein COV13_01370 [Candidatus Woesearchaeota archaeon CG10_big_fil_rev_8_21_14_0_10_32_9]
MGKLILLLLILLAFVVSIDSGFASSENKLKSFELAIAEYGIEESSVVGEYALLETEEIPIYEFEYIWKKDSTESKLVSFVKKIFNIHKKIIKIPAIDLSDEEWGRYGDLFLLPIEDVYSRFNVDKKDVLSYELEKHNDLPMYRITTSKLQQGLEGEPEPVVLVVPAIELGLGSTSDGEYNEQLWKMWRGGSSIKQKTSECITPSAGLELSGEINFCQGEYFLGSNGMKIVDDGTKIYCSETIIIGDFKVYMPGFENIGHNDVEIEGCQIENFNIGILFQNVSGGSISRNKVYLTKDIGQFGIEINTSSNVTLIQNEVEKYNSGVGITLQNSKSLWIEKNFVKSNNDVGLLLGGVSDTRIEGNIIEENDVGVLFNTNYEKNYNEKIFLIDNIICKNSYVDLSCGSYDKEISYDGWGNFIDTFGEGQTECIYWPNEEEYKSCDDLDLTN